MRCWNFRSLAAAILLGAALPTFAAELAGAPPLAIPSGVQSDAATGSLTQGFSSQVAGTIESIVWWGFHGQNSNGPSFDDFVVKLNGSPRAGAISKIVDPNGVARYELKIAPTPLSPSVKGSLEIVNDSEDVEWFWQYSNVGTDEMAYSLRGVPVPEPGSYALMLTGLVVLVSAARRGRQT